MENEEVVIKEGLAILKTKSNVFYNPVQVFNRDLSICVLSVLSSEFHESNNDSEGKSVNVVKNEALNENNITILEALSASGLRSIRYAKEIPGVKEIIANDISKSAVESIEKNIKLNEVDNIVKASHSDAVMLMYNYRKEKKFHAIDLDPYGCPAMFLDAAVQAVKDNGILLVTATDMAILAGNCPETCYVKYGAISLKMKSCHEMALRILLQCIEAHANRYGRYIEPLLSISADFYIRVFVKLHSGAAKCKFTTSKLSMVYNCTGCGTFTLQPLGIMKKNKNNFNFGLPTGPPVNSNCQHCNYRHHMGGPIWSGTLHSIDFVSKILEYAFKTLATWERIRGKLEVIREELNFVPLYYTLDRLSSTLHCETPPMLLVRSALLNGGYNVSYMHANKNSIKTDAPSSFIWDIMRCWEKKHPVKRDRLAENNPALFILNQEMTHKIDFTHHPNANPNSRKMGLVRFQENPTANWGPGIKSTAMLGDQTISKSKKNQGKNQQKRKRDNSQESDSEQSKIKIDPAPAP